MKNHARLIRIVTPLTLALLLACSSTSGSKDTSADTLREASREHAVASPRVLEAMQRVPRERFVPEELRSQATEGGELKIGFGQTISESTVVAMMTEHAEVGRGARVLEIGTGSGYQAAVLAELGAEVFSVEIIPELSERARRTLYSLGYENVRLRVGDGALGWQEHAPFDAIIVTAAAPRVPQELLSQLAPNGKLLVPIESSDGEDSLLLISRSGDSIVTKRLGQVTFMPLEGIVREATVNSENYVEPQFLQEYFSIETPVNDPLPSVSEPDASKVPSATH